LQMSLQLYMGIHNGKSSIIRTRLLLFGRNGIVRTLCVIRLWTLQIEFAAHMAQTPNQVTGEFQKWQVLGEKYNYFRFPFQFYFLLLQ